MSTTSRPPKAPRLSAASAPKNALEAAAMNSFRHKVEAANKTAICTANTNVGRRTMREILASGKYNVPIFQRRYCWTETQWKTLLMDADRGTMQALGKHSLGRLTCTNVADNARSCILDGQQRFTTTTILLASIRDCLECLDAEDPLISCINNLLFPDVNDLENWLSDPSFMLEEGIELSFARLTPTFCDRLSYYAAILPKGPTNRYPELSHSWHRPLKAKLHFDAQLKERTQQQLRTVGKAVLDSFHMLNFPITIDQGHQDGTEDLMVVYERLALRDATFCKPHRETEYLPMDGTDMIRNLLLGSFDSESEAIAYYKEYWLPVERAVSMEGSDCDMKQLLKAFLASREYDKGVAAFVGGQLYADFQSWLSKALLDQKGATKDPKQLARSIAKELLCSASDSGAL